MGYNRSWFAARYLSRKLAGLCVDCTYPREHLAHVRCDACMDLRAEDRRARRPSQSAKRIRAAKERINRQKLQKARLCISCYMPLAGAAGVRCEVCAAIMCGAARARRRVCKLFTNYTAKNPGISMPIDFIRWVLAAAQRVPHSLFLGRQVETKARWESKMSPAEFAEYLLEESMEVR